MRYSATWIGDDTSRKHIIDVGRDKRLSDEEVAERLNKLQNFFDAMWAASREFRRTDMTVEQFTRANP